MVISKGKSWSSFLFFSFFFNNSVARVCFTLSDRHTACIIKYVCTKIRIWFGKLSFTCYDVILWTHLKIYANCSQHVNHIYYTIESIIKVCVWKKIETPVHTHTHTHTLWHGSLHVLCVQWNTCIDLQLTSSVELKWPVSVMCVRDIRSIGRLYGSSIDRWSQWHNNNAIHLWRSFMSYTKRHCYRSVFFLRFWSLYGFEWKNNVIYGFTSTLHGLRT